MLPWFGETLFQRQDLPFSKPQPLPLSAALAEHCGCAEFEALFVLEELLAWLEESKIQLRLFSKPQPSPLSIAALVHIGLPDWLDDETEEELADWLLLGKIQLRLFSQPQPSPLFIAELLHTGVLPFDLEEVLADDELTDDELEDTLHDRPFSTPQPPEPIVAEAEHTGWPVAMTQDRLFSQPQPSPFVSTIALVHSGIAWAVPGCKIEAPAINARLAKLRAKDLSDIVLSELNFREFLEITKIRFRIGWIKTSVKPTNVRVIQSAGAKWQASRQPHDEFTKL